MSSVDMPLTPLITAIAAAIASLAIWHQISINRRNKRIDIIAGCNSRYDDIYRDRMKLFGTDNTRREVAAYYGRFWGLKSDQVDYWLAGFVDIETFTDWCFMTVKSFRDDHDFSFTTSNGNHEMLTFDQGWETIGLPDHQVTNPWFTELTKAQRELGKIWEVAIKRAGRNAEDLEKAKGEIRKTLSIIIRIIETKSRTYRRYLLHEMTQGQYENSNREFPILGLTMRNRDAVLSEIDRRRVYWRMRGAPLLGRFLAYKYPTSPNELKTYSLSEL